MLKKSLIVAGALVFATSAFAQSGSTKGSSMNSPGQQMQNSKAPSTGSGASEFAPGQKMQDAKPGTNTGNGASNYAPGHQTTGSAKTK